MTNGDRYLFRIPSGKQINCTGIKGRLRQANKNTTSKYTWVIFSYLKDKDTLNDCSTFRSFDSVTPVKALVIPHSMVQMPMYKDGLVGQKISASTVPSIVAHSTWKLCLGARYAGSCQRKRVINCDMYYHVGRNLNRAVGHE